MYEPPPVADAVNVAGCPTYTGPVGGATVTLMLGWSRGSNDSTRKPTGAGRREGDKEKCLVVRTDLRKNMR